MGTAGQDKAPKAGNSPSWCSLNNPKEIVYPSAPLGGAEDKFLMIQVGWFMLLVSKYLPKLV